jgi:hypothetical protein
MQTTMLRKSFVDHIMHSHQQVAKKAFVVLVSSEAG